jgi:hypothetical protein
MRGTSSRELVTGTFKCLEVLHSKRRVPVGNGCCAILVPLQIYILNTHRPGERVGGKLFTGMWAKVKQPESLEGG